MSTYKTTATVQWVVDLPANCTTEEEKQAAAYQDLQRVLGDNEGRFTYLQIDKLDKMKDRKGRIVLGRYSVEDVLSHVGQEDRKTYVTPDGKEWTVKMTSHRYFIFCASRKCVSCGIDGSIMLLEMHPHDTTPHFNMYAEEDDELVLMTKDHIHPKMSGGADRHSNYQTMCSICNNLKGSDPITISETRNLREIHREHSKRLTKKEIHKLIRAEKDAILASREKSDVEYQIQDNTVITKCDVDIYINDDGSIHCAAVYDGVLENNKHIACLKKGTYLYPVGTDGEKIVLKFGDEIFTLHKGLTEPAKERSGEKCLLDKESCDTAPNCVESAQKSGGS